MLLELVVRQAVRLWPVRAPWQAGSSASSGTQTLCTWARPLASIQPVFRAGASGVALTLLRV